MAPPLFRLPAIELPDAFIRAPAVGPQPFLLPWLHDVVSQVDVFTQLLHIQMRDVPQRLQRRHRVALSGIVPNNADVLHFAVLMYFLGL